MASGYRAWQDGPKTHIELYQGATLDLVFTVQSPYSFNAARLKVRPTRTSPTLLLSLSEADGVTIEPGTGLTRFRVQRSAAQTSALDWGTVTSGEYDFEIVRSDNGQVYRAAYGRMALSKEVEGD